jgi:radical SAM/Cys-rich protein
MTRETMEACLVALSKSDVPFVDLTGGAPEMNPDFRWFVDRVVEMERKVMVRCNLTIIVANKKYHDLPDYYARHGVHVISSLPSFDQKNTDRQRGDGVFEESIRALKMLNAVGYGAAGSGLKLDLVYNPVGALLPGSQSSLQEQFKRILKTRHDVNFNDLICITNMPISRFLEYLLESGNYGRYMEELVNAFNPAAVDGVMCRDTL